MNKYIGLVVLFSIHAAENPWAVVTYALKSDNAQEWINRSDDGKFYDLQGSKDFPKMSLALTDAQKAYFPYWMAQMKRTIEQYPVVAGLNFIDTAVISVLSAGTYGAAKIIGTNSYKAGAAAAGFVVWSILKGRRYRANRAREYNQSLNLFTVALNSSGEEKEVTVSFNPVLLPCAVDQRAREATMARIKDILSGSSKYRFFGDGVGLFNPLNGSAWSPDTFYGEYAKRNSTAQ